MSGWAWRCSGGSMASPLHAAMPALTPDTTYYYAIHNNASTSAAASAVHDCSTIASTLGHATPLHIITFGDYGWKNMQSVARPPAGRVTSRQPRPHRARRRLCIQPGRRGRQQERHVHEWAAGLLGAHADASVRGQPQGRMSSCATKSCVVQMKYMEAIPPSRKLFIDYAASLAALHTSVGHYCTTALRCCLLTATAVPTAAILF